MVRFPTLSKARPRPTISSPSWSLRLSLPPGYDELRREYLFKNLYQSNNLETWRERSDKASITWPKVFTFSRAELLAGTQYESSFLPLEMNHEDKDTALEAQQFFREIRLASFDAAQLNAYVLNYVALTTRDKFMERFGKLPAVCCGLQKLVREMSRAGELSKLQRAVLGCATVDSPGVESGEFMREAAKFWGMAKKEAEKDADEHELVDCIRLLAALRSASSKTGERLGQKQLAELRGALHDADVWSPTKYFTTLDSLKELKELLVTPFMIKIIAEILPILSGQ